MALRRPCSTRELRRNSPNPPFKFAIDTLLLISGTGYASAAPSSRAALPTRPSATPTGPAPAAPRRAAARCAVTLRSLQALLAPQVCRGLPTIELSSIGRGNLRTPPEAGTLLKWTSRSLNADGPVGRTNDCSNGTLRCPVLDFQTLYSSEVLFVVSHEGEIVRQSRRCNQQVQVVNGRTQLLQRSFCLAERFHDSR